MSNHVVPDAPPSKASECTPQTRGEFVTSHSQPESEFIDEKELLRRLPVSRRTLHNWRRAGKIPCIVIGRRVIFSWDNVARSLRRLEQGGQ